jgi:Skp family chaperone for outer membrane proteins
MKAIATYLSISSTILMLGGLIWTQQATADPKIGVVNITQLLADSPNLKTAIDALQNEFEPRRLELLKMQSAAQANPKDENLQREFNRQVTEFQSKTYARRLEATLVVKRSIIDAIRKYAASEDFDLVGSTDPLFIKPPLKFIAEPIDITDKLQAFILNPSASSGASSKNAGEVPRTKIAVVKALNVIAGSSAERIKLRDYASQHGFGIVLEAVYYAKPQFTITDITADVLALPH